MHLGAAGVDARHPMDLVAEAIGVESVSEYAELAARLRDIAGELDDAALDLLNRAVADGATARPAEDKTLTQARRAVEKAATLLESLQLSRLRRTAERRATCSAKALSTSIRAAQVAVLVLGELEADARQLDAVGLADLDGERVGALDPPRRHEVGELLVEQRRAVRRRVRSAGG